MVIGSIWVTIKYFEPINLHLENACSGLFTVSEWVLSVALDGLTSVICWLCMGFVIRAPVHINGFMDACVQYIWKAQIEGQTTEMHRLNPRNNDSLCDTALFITVHGITMVEPLHKN